MWYNNKNENNMNKSEFDMGDEKIIEYTQSKPIVDHSDINSKIDKDEKTIGFYSEEELNNNENIYNFSDDAKKFVNTDLGITRYNRHYLIREIANIFSMNMWYGISNVFKYIIIKQFTRLCEEYHITAYSLNILIRIVMLYIADNFNGVNFYNYNQVIDSPDMVFSNFNNYSSKETYDFFEVRRNEENIDCVSYKIRHIEFNFVDRKYRVIGVPMHANISSETSEVNRVDFEFNTTSIIDIIRNINTINDIKGAK